MYWKRVEEAAAPSFIGHKNEIGQPIRLPDFQSMRFAPRRYFLLPGTFLPL